jgi:hypothetical protein
MTVVVPTVKADALLMTKEKLLQPVLLDENV